MKMAVCLNGSLAPVVAMLCCVVWCCSCGRTSSSSKASVELIADVGGYFYGLRRASPSGVQALALSSSGTQLLWTRDGVFRALYASEFFRVVSEHCVQIPVQVGVWDLESATMLLRFDIGKRSVFMGDIEWSAGAVFTSGTQGMWFCNGQDMVLWSFVEKRRVASVQLGYRECRKIASSADSSVLGVWCQTGGLTEDIVLGMDGTGRVLFDAKVPDLWDVAVSRDGRTIVAVSRETGLVAFSSDSAWDSSKAVSLTTTGSLAAGFASDKYMVSLNTSGTLTAWSTPGWQEVGSAQMAQPFAYAVNAVFCSTQERVATATPDGVIEVRTVPGLSVERSAQVYLEGRPSSLVLSDDGQTILCGDATGRIYRIRLGDAGR